MNSEYKKKFPASFVLIKPLQAHKYSFWKLIIDQLLSKPFSHG